MAADEHLHRRLKAFVKKPLYQTIVEHGALLDPFVPAPDVISSRSDPRTDRPIVLRAGLAVGYLHAAAKPVINKIGAVVQGWPWNDLATADNTGKFNVIGSSSILAQEDHVSGLNGESNRRTKDARAKS